MAPGAPGPPGAPPFATWAGFGLCETGGVLSSGGLSLWQAPIPRLSMAPAAQSRNCFVLFIGFLIRKYGAQVRQTPGSPMGEPGEKGQGLLASRTRAAHAHAAEFTAHTAGTTHHSAHTATGPTAGSRSNPRIFRRRSLGWDDIERQLIAQRQLRALAAERHIVDYRNAHILHSVEPSQVVHGVGEALTLQRHVPGLASREGDGGQRRQVVGIRRKSLDGEYGIRRADNALIDLAIVPPGNPLAPVGGQVLKADLRAS